MSTTGPVVGTAAAPSLHIMTWNIRRRVSCPSPRKADRWAHRAPRLRALLQAEQPTVLGAQEALADQADYVEESLGGDYRFLGHGRGSRGSGEGTPIFFDTRRLELLAWDQAALSKTPAKPGSRSWGSLYPRIVVSAHFRDRTTSATFIVINTHLDQLSARARMKSAQIIRNMVWATAEPVVVTGDFNAEVGSKPMRLLQQEGQLVDSWATAEQRSTSAWGTLANYRRPRRDKRRVDWVLASPTVTVENVAVNHQRWAGGWGSDHLPVHALLRLPTA